MLHWCYATNVLCSMLAVLNVHASNAVNPIANVIVTIWDLFIYGPTADLEHIKSTSHTSSNHLISRIT